MDMEKNNYHKISVADMAPHVHSFLPKENKVGKIVDWLINWITFSLECGKIQPFDLLPTKADLACHIGVSQGTVQSAYRVLENAGYVESKQRIGTYIKLKDNKPKLAKLTSKRELAIELLKKYLVENSYKTGEYISSVRKLSEYFGVSVTTLQTAVNNLVALGVLKKVEKKYVVLKTDFKIEKIQTKTLVEKIAEKIRDYVVENLRPGDKLPTNNYFSSKFNVSVKTIYDAEKMLVKEGLLYARRGTYGTIVLGDEAEQINIEQYSYEKVEQKIRQYILENCQISDKLPTIKEFSEIYDISARTIKKALDNLAEDGYIAFSRGRYGGTFVLDIPQSSSEAYKWLAISTDYMPN